MIFFHAHVVNQGLTAECLQNANMTQHDGQRHCEYVACLLATKQHAKSAEPSRWQQDVVTIAGDKNKTILLRQPDVRLATVGWNRHCKHTVADTKHDDLYVGAQPMTAGCNRRCRLSFRELKNPVSAAQLAEKDWL